MSEDTEGTVDANGVTGPSDDLTADLEAEFGFEPVVADRVADRVARRGSSDDTTAAVPAQPTRPGTKRADVPSGTRRPRNRGGFRRRVSAFGVLLVALVTMGGAYAAFASSSTAADSSDASASVAHGKQLFSVACITCHGANLQGVLNRGPSLIGVGGAATYFQVSTGRMPLAQQGAYAARKTPKYTDEEVRALAAYVQSVGGGQSIPTGQVRGGSDTVAEGGELFRINCASCHGTTFKGAPLSAGKQAPSLNAATDLQITTAMLSGPESMPVFSNNQLTVAEKQAIVAYIQTIKASNDPGGSGIGRIGPVSEAIVIWVAGVGLLMVAILWIGARSQ